MPTTTHLWRVIQEWMDGQLFPVSAATLAERVGVTRSAMFVTDASRRKCSGRGVAWPCRSAGRSG